MNDRETLTAIIEVSGVGYADAACAADSVIARGWRPPGRVIDDPDTPDDFPIRTAGFDCDGDVWVSTYAGWATVTIDAAVSLADVVDCHSPLTIMYIPTEEPR